jgi:thiol-disulfide isomerase/thioredoxin
MSEMKTNRPQHRPAWLAAAFLLTLALPGFARLRADVDTNMPRAAQIAGEWNATVTVGSAEIPFRFEISAKGTELQGFFFEGEKKIGSSSGKYDDGNIQFDYEHLNSTLIARLNGETLDGTYRFNRKNGREYKFHATRAADPVKTRTVSAPPNVKGDWEMKLVGPDNSTSKDARVVLSWKLYLRQSGAKVTGSILRVDGDTGNLTGGWQGDSLVLSHFAGERPVLLEAHLQADGTLDILLNKQNKYLGARIADAQAKGIPAPPDAAKFTDVKDRQEPFHFSFPDLDGKIVSDQDAIFQNKVVILAIGGTWCPNCRDEAPFLVNFYRKYHKRGLEIVGLNFEASGELAEDKPRIQSFVEEFSIPYPILYAGATPDVTKRLPQLANFGAYPTTIFLGRDGRVAVIHAGFASAATGEAHVKLQHDVDELLKRLLSGKPEQQVGQ